MISFINKIVASNGNRKPLIELVLRGSEAMSGCLSYIVLEDAEDENTIWVFETWDTADSQKAATETPEVSASIEAAMPIIASFESVAKLTPVHGIGNSI